MQGVNGAPPAFVLVHGGFSGGWCWDRVSERLTGAGKKCTLFAHRPRSEAPALSYVSDRNLCPRTLVSYFNGGIELSCQCFNDAGAKPWL